MFKWFWTNSRWVPPQHDNFTQGFFLALLTYFRWADLNQKLKKTVEGLLLKNLRGSCPKNNLITSYILFFFFF